MKRVIVMLVCGFILMSHFSWAQKKSQRRAKKSVYEEVDLEQMIKRYFGKNPGTTNSIEGIYSVSCAITKRSRHFLTGAERMRVVERKDNYARVAILKDWPSSKRDLIEISMNSATANKYPIVGEYEVLSENRGYVYRHIEPDGSRINYSMIFDNFDLLEGEYSKIEKRKTITYRLSYMKIYPKSSELNVRNQE